MTTRPNVLLVVFDSLSARQLNTQLATLPTLQQLVTTSLSFTAAYTCSPESSPARASLFTGLDMAAHGLWTDGVTLPKRETPIPAAFARNGYRSWLVGRRQLAGVSNWTTEHARPDEYHHFDWAHGPLHRSRQNAYLAWLQETDPDLYARIFPRQADPDDPLIPTAQRQGMAALPDELSFNTWVGRQARSHIGDTPFFGVASFCVGAGMGASAAIVEPLDARALAQADAALGEILKDLPGNTVIALTAGRGSIDADIDDPMQRDAINVPLLLRLESGKTGRMEKPVSTIDIAPTLYQLAGIVAPQRIQGQSLISTKPRGWALSRLRVPGQPHQTLLTSGRWTLVVTHHAPDATRLYDDCAGTIHRRNLADEAEHQDDLEAMMDLMIDARVALEDRTEPRIAKF